MAKERTILALIAIVTGLIIASSVFYFYQKGGAEEHMRTPPPSPTASPNGKTILDIENPENESITDKKTAEVKGTSQASALIVITTATDDFVLEASSDGTFTKNVTLVEDENLLTVTAYTDGGTSETKEIAVTYTTEEF